ncbi:hypothetical protein MBTS_22450 [Methylobacterium bullatum]|nr:hypothetical protein [Methylobacterium bullatum]
MLGETWYCLHQLTMDADDMPDFLARMVSHGDTRLPELLEAFVVVFCECDSLPDGREAFSSPDNLLSSMKALTRTGFAERVGDQFRWTSQIAPTMRALSLWDENRASLSDASAKAFEANARLAWQTMPEPMKMALLSDKIGFIQFAKILALGWKEGGWVSYRLDDQFELKGEITLARRILELAATGK